MAAITRMEIPRHWRHRVSRAAGWPVEELLPKGCVGALAPASPVWPLARWARRTPMDATWRVRPSTPAAEGMITTARCNLARLLCSTTSRHARWDLRRTSMIKLRSELLIAKNMRGISLSLASIPTPRVTKLPISNASASSSRPRCAGPMVVLAFLTDVEVVGFSGGLALASTHR